METLKKTGLFICLWISVLSIIDLVRGSEYYFDENILGATALSIIIVYVWGKINNKYL